MAWGAWNRKPADAATMAVGLDVNSSRIRASAGPAFAATPHVLPLDGPHAELPLIISFERRALDVGRAGYHLVRRLPHLVCRDYLPELGRERQWSGGRHRIDSAAAITATIAHLRKSVPANSSMGVVVPGYFTGVQSVLFVEFLDRAKLPALGHVPVPLALAATDDAAFGTALVLDADERALTWSVLMADANNARLLASHSLPGAGVRAWYDRLIDCAADRCIRLCRRDPRDSAVAEQGLFEQFDAALNSLQPGVPVTLDVRTAHWFQELRLTPDDLETFGAPLIRAAVDGMRQALAEAHATMPVLAQPDLLWITAEAMRLPGLAAAVTQHLPEAAITKVLAADALAAAGHALAGHWLRGDLPRGRLDSVAPRFGVRTGPAPNRLDALHARTRQV